MNTERILAAALRLLRIQPGLSQSEVARCLNLPREDVREALQAGERQGTVSVTFGPPCPVWHTRPRQYRPAFPWLVPSLRAAFSAVYSFPKITLVRLAAVLEVAPRTAARLVVKLERAGLIVSKRVSRGRLCVPAPWVLA